MKNTTKALLVATSSLISVQAFAHPGHDHAGNTAMLSHVAFYGCIAAALAIATFAAVKVLNKSK